MEEETQGLPHGHIGYFFIGLSLAVFSSVFIGSSFIIKKIGLKRLNSSGYIRAGAGGYSYLREWIWWLGLLMMGLGEAMNFAAYAFAPASLVTPLGALSVLVAAVLSSKILKETLNFLGKLGCFLCIVGSTVIVIHAPKQEEIDSLEDLQRKLLEPSFLTYLSLIILVYISIAFYYSPRIGNQNILINLLLCSAVGSLTVVFCKGIGISLKETFSGESNDFRNWLFWVLIIATVLCIVIQMNYLNKSLDIFNTSLVTPLYYVMFTSLVIIASAILFQEWKNMSLINALGSVCGFLVIVVGILLLNAFKDIDVTFMEVFNSLRTKREDPQNEDDVRVEVVYGATRTSRL